MKLADITAGKRRGTGIFGALAAGLMVLLLLLAAGCGDENSSAATVDTGGSLQLKETYYDFGSVPVGQLVEHRFELKNTGTGPLKLGQMSVKRLEGC